MSPRELECDIPDPAPWLVEARSVVAHLARLAELRSALTEALSAEHFRLGLKLSQTTGTISGTPRQSGSFRVTLGARDALGAKSQRTLVLLVTT